MDFPKPIGKRTRVQVLASWLAEIEARKKTNKPSADSSTRNTGTRRQTNKPSSDSGTRNTGRRRGTSREECAGNQAKLYKSDSFTVLDNGVEEDQVVEAKKGVLEGGVESTRPKSRKGPCFDKVGEKKKVGFNLVAEEEEVISLDSSSDEETDESCSYVSSSEEEEDRDEIEQTIESDEERVIKRRKVSGLDADANDVEVPTSSNVRNCVARRTRSHYGSNPFSKKNIGTISRPICFDLSTSDEDNNAGNEDSNVADNLEDCDNSECIGHRAKRKDNTGDKEELCSNAGDHIANRNGNTRDKEELCRNAGEEFREGRKRKRGHPPKDGFLFDLLVNTIWEKGGEFQQQHMVSKIEAEEPFLVKFNFGVEKPKPVEKTDGEKLMDTLWTEMDFVLQSCELGSYPADTEDSNELNVKTDPSSRCSQGKHDFILDEEIGIKCRICCFVKTEIRYVLPPLVTNCYERSAKKNSSDEGVFSIWERPFFQDVIGDLQGSSVHGKGTVWEIFPRIREKLYPHQKEGFEFLWKNIAGGIELDKLTRASSGSIGGCVISHAPGTGKTLLTIVFLQSYMEVFKECRPVIIAPYSMLLTWEQELKTWNVKTPFHNLNSLEFTGKEDEIALELIKGKSKNKKWSRIVKLLSWTKGKSILGVSYSLFVKLAGSPLDKDEDNKKQKKFLQENEAKEISRILLEKPSLLVLDEGHTARNKRSNNWQVLDKVKTKRRIILSGTPFQNNFEELGNTLSLARPKFLDSILSSKFKIISNVMAKKQARKEWASLTKSINYRADDKILEKIRGMVAPFVHVHKGSILKDSLPGLRDCVVYLNPTPKQMELLEEVQEIENQLELGHAVSLVSVHPSLIVKCGCFRNQKDIIDENLLSSNQFRLNHCHGVKTRFLVELIRLSETKNEKVLVFSQFLDPLYLIKDQLYKIFCWTEGDQILQMDGNRNMEHRQSMINLFNDPHSNVKVLLASTKACREGISLIGASRIVLLDVVWNPSVERQAISRAYRLGQKNIVYTYHLITSMELQKYGRQVSKDRLSELLFYSTRSEDDRQKRSTVQDDEILEAMVGNKELEKMFDKIIYQPKESHLIDTYFEL